MAKAVQEPTWEGPVDLAATIAWIEDTLKVPNGPLAGRPFRVEGWQAEWLHEAFADGVREAGMSVARKNGKSGFIAAVLLAGLLGPMNRRDWRGVVTSMTGFLAAELRDAILSTAKASNLFDRISLYKAPPPGRIIGRRGARLDFLAADKATGHAIGCDLALLDEAGLMQENQRALWNAIFSSVSGRDGRFWAISIQGTGPMFAEMEKRAGSPSLHWRKWSAPLECEIDDEDAWHAANPGLIGGIKSRDYMRDAAERARGASGNEMYFRQYDLNQPVDAERQVIVQVRDYRACIAEDAPDLAGDIVLGIDLGGSVSMTCAAAYSLETKRLKTWGAFGDDPPLSKRAKSDRMGSLYDRMVREGELRLYPGRITPVIPFLEQVFAEIAGKGRVIAIGADRHRKEEARTAFDTANISYVPVKWRGQGASATADGSHDVRAFQRAIFDKRICTPGSTMLESAIASSVLRFDKAGNPAIDKAANNARIDALSASVIALGLAELVKPAPLLQVHVV
ncbi:MAG: hypothetical protein OXP75_01125 [Rhodospirillales bacterium]|nr:hypothetical protein [Rhodospirillales bacterium]